MIDDKDLAEALDRIGRSPDGRLLYLFCQKTLCQVLPGDQTESALREHEGRRRFAAELMGHMSKGIQDSDRHAITFTVTRAARTGGAARGAGRRVTLDTPVAGWDSPDSGTSSSDAA